MAAVRHFEFEFKFQIFSNFKFKFFQISNFKFQISFESDDFRLRYSDKTIFKMAADRYLEFSTFGILVMCPVLEPHSGLSYKISH